MVRKLMLAICILFLLSACTTKNIVKHDKTDEEVSPGDTFGFTLFNLSADTKELKQAIIANFEENADQTKAEYENKIEDEYKYGNKAMEKLKSIFENLDIDPETPDEDIIKKVSEAFEIFDYKNLSVKIKFKGRDLKELKMTK